MERSKMIPFSEAMSECKRQLNRGHIQVAYRGLMDFIRDLRSHFRNRFPEYSVSSRIYSGYMDMSYFAIIPPSLAPRSLKIALVFLQEEFRFEVWLSGSNQKVQEKYWHLLKEAGPQHYPLASDPTASDYVIRHILIEDPDFSDQGGLTQQIERGTSAFIRDVEKALS